MKYFIITKRGIFIAVMLVLTGIILIAALGGERSVSTAAGTKRSIPVYCVQTDEKKLEESIHKERILRAVHYDELTGLPNLSYFFKLAESAKAAFLSDGKEIALLYMDLNGMKNFNFRHGFAEGDKLLLAFAETLKNAFGWEKVCHIGAEAWGFHKMTDSF